MGRRSAAAADEEAELLALSDQAEQTRRAVAETADALTRTISAPATATVPLRRVIVMAVPALVVLTAAAIYLLRRYPR